MRSVWVLAILLTVACGETADPSSDPEPEGEAEDDGRGHGHSEGAPPPGDPAPAELLRMTGEVTLANATVRAGTPIEAGQAIDVPDGGQAIIQLRDGGRVELDGGSRAFILDDGGAQLALVSGALYAVQPPEGNAPRPPLRIVSSSASVEIGQNGELYYMQFESGSSWLATLVGAITVCTGEADNRRQLREVQVRAGQAVVINNRIGEPIEGPTRLTGAREAAAVFHQADTGLPDVEHFDGELVREAERLDGALRWLETETRQGRELTSQHRAAVRDGDTDLSQQLQRQLVEHSRSLYRLRRLATARWERLQAIQLRRAMLPGVVPDPVGDRRDRVAGLLGFH